MNPAIYRKKPCDLSSVVRFGVGAKTERRYHVIQRLWHTANDIKILYSRFIHFERAGRPVSVSSLCQTLISAM